MIGKLKMFWSALTFLRLLRILGTFEIFWIIWILRRMRRGRHVQTVCMPSDNEQLLADLNSIDGDFHHIQEGMEVLLANQLQAEQASEDHLREHDRARNELHEKIQENAQALRADIQSNCHLNERHLAALLQDAQMKHNEEMAEYRNAAYRTTAAIKKLQKTSERFQDVFHHFQADSVRDDQEKFKEMQMSFEEKYEAFLKETDDTCAKCYEDDRTEEAKNRKVIQDEIIERYKIAIDATSEMETRHIDRVAKLEVCLMGRMDEPILPLIHQNGDGRTDEVITFLWKIRGFKDKLNFLREEARAITSGEFLIEKNGLKVQAALNRKDDFIEIHLKFIQDNNEDNGAANCSPFWHYRRFTLIDQTEPSATDTIELIDRPPFAVEDENMMQAHFSNPGLCRMEEFEGESKYVKNDAILVTVALEPVDFITPKMSAHDGIFTWKIEGYSTKVQDQITGRKRWLISKPFRTSEAGYHAQVEVLFSGDGDEVDDGNKGYISIRVRFIFGIHDRWMQNPLRGSVQHTLIDQICSKHYDVIGIKTFQEFGLDDITKKHSKASQAEISTEVKEWDIPRCFLRSVAEKEPYLMRDTIKMQTVLHVY